MRPWPLLTCCVALAAPAGARDLDLTVTWDIASDAQLVTVVRRADGAVLSVTRDPVALTDQARIITLSDLPRQAMSVQAGIVGTTTIWAQSPVSLIEARQDTLSLDLSRHLVLSRISQHDCGEALGIATLAVATGQLTFAGLPDLTPNAPTGPELVTWTLDSGATVTQSGTRLMVQNPDGSVADCPGVPTPPLLPVAVRGDAGAWALDLGPDSSQGRLPDGWDSLPPQAERLTGTRDPDGRIRFAHPAFTLHLTDLKCRQVDALTPFPFRAELSPPAGSPVEARFGCAGSPLDLLAGPDWKVTSVLGRPPAGEFTLSFVQGEVAGRGTCNRYLAALTFADGRMEVSDLGTTRLGCDADARNLELRFLDALDAANGFEIGNDGALILRAGAIPVLTARRPK